MARYLLALALLSVLAGCPVTQPQETPVSARHLALAGGGGKYWLYVPSYYTAEHDWPVVITLHGTHAWDSAKAQIKEWKALAEEKGFIVAAPELKSPQGIIPVIRSLWYEDLAEDERAVLSLLEELERTYRIDPKAVLLTGFSAGGYPLYYIGLRNPRRFNMLIARACNSDLELLEKLNIKPEARRLPIRLFWGKDDLWRIQKDSWQAFRYLREHGFFQAKYKEVKGGHLRRPGLAYRLWLESLPRRHRR